MQIKVLMYEDELKYSEPLAELLSSDIHFDLRGNFSHCKNIIKQIEDAIPDIILMDIQLPEINGIQATKIIKENYPATNVIILSSFGDDDFIFNAIMAGATSYILKGDTTIKILDAIKETYNGGSPISPSIARKVLSLFTQNTNLSEKQKLTEQQFKILKLMKEGLSYKMVAHELDITLSTVQVHIRNIYHRLQVNSKSQAFKKLFR